MSVGQQTVVAIPVRNEERHLTACLDGLLAQTHRADAIVLLLNNCHDASLDICRQVSQSVCGLHIVECQLNGHEASAGEARRLALIHAHTLAANGVILTTDADSTVPATWVADNLAEIAKGADCVCGMAVIAPEDDGANRQRLEFDDMRETLLIALQDEIAAIVDPDPFDPWPRHQQNSGASIAVRADILHRAGGPPRIACGEDRALVAKLALFDAKICHPPHLQVAVSGRLNGRATGGMAETIARRLQRQDQLTDDILEPTVDAYRRVLARVRLRAIIQGVSDFHDLAADLLITPPILQSALQAPYFGAAWARIEQQSPMLRRRRVAFIELARETRQAFALRDHLHATLNLHMRPADCAELRHAM
jgi:hypothetical protein